MLINMEHFEQQRGDVNSRTGAAAGTLFVCDFSPLAIVKAMLLVAALFLGVVVVSGQ